MMRPPFGDAVPDLQCLPAGTQDNVWAATQAETWGPQNKAAAKTSSKDCAVTGKRTGLEKFKHEQQKDQAFGTKENPVNDNCQTTTLKNLFHFYGMDAQADEVKPQMTTLLDRLRNQQGKGMNLQELSNTFERDSSSHFKTDDVKEALKTGDKNSVFQSTQYDSEGKPVGETVSPETSLAYLSEMGCKPEGVKLGAENSDKVRAALEKGEPVIFTDSDTHSLYALQAARSNHEDVNGLPKTNHTYMAFKMGNEYVLSEPSVGEPMALDKETIEQKLLDSNSGAIIIHHAPDPCHFLNH
jgi:hypothetical protein